MPETEAMPPVSESLWTASEVAKFLHRSQRWIYTCLARPGDHPGSIPHYRLPGGAPRFHPPEILDWVREGCPPAGTFRAWHRKNGKRQGLRRASTWACPTPSSGYTVTPNIVNTYGV